MWFKFLSELIRRMASHHSRKKILYLLTKPSNRTRMKKLLLAIAFLFISLSTFSQTLYTNDFTAGSAGWSLGMGGNFDTWIVNNVYNCSDITPNQGGGNYMHIYDDLFGEMCAFSGFLGFGSAGIVYATQTSDISSMGYSNVNITFDWLCQGQTGPILPSFGFIDYSTNGGANWINITSPIAQYNGQSTWTSVSINSAAMGNQPTLRIRFGFNNSGYGLNPAFAVDNLTITGTGGSCTNLGGIANASPTNICTGNTSVVTVVASIGTIQWEQSPDGIGSWINVVGGSGATTANYTTAALATTTYYRAKLSQPSCPDVYSTVTSVTVNPAVAASVIISASPLGPICAGTNVTFTATPTNGGTPTYQWYVGATPVGTGNTFSSSGLLNGNQISCVMTSSAACVTGSPATSNTITMTVNPNPVATITPAGPISFCNDTTIILYCGPVGTYSWSTGSTANNETPVISGNYCVTVVDGNGCSDTTCVMVNIDAMPDLTTSMLSSISIHSNANSATYQWIDCSTGNPISGEVNQDFTATVNGDYAVIVTDGLCGDTSACVNINNVGLDDYSISNLRIYPNPSNGIFTMSSTTEGNYSIVNELGQTVLFVYLNVANNYSMQVEGLNNGIYFIVGGKNGIVKRKIIVAK